MIPALAQFLLLLLAGLLLTAREVAVGLTFVEVGDLQFLNPLRGQLGGDVR